MRYKIVLAYDGAMYSGWQIQAVANPPPTIQGELEKALGKLTGEKIRVIGSGRTDAGVHAHGQVAHFSSSSEKIMALPDFRFTLNALLPRDIRVIQVNQAPDNFHAQHDALDKTYIYQLWTEPAFTPPHILGCSWQCGILNFPMLEKTCLAFQGTRDFASFQNAGTPIKDTTRSILEVNVKKLANREFYPEHAPMLAISIRANGFLKQMVRNIIGFAVAAAKGKVNPDCLDEIFAARDRRSLPTATAPAKGLFLARVNYGDFR